MSMIDAVTSPAWGELGDWASQSGRSVQLSYSASRWTVGLYDHLPSGPLAASCLSFGTPLEPFGDTARRALEGVEHNRAEVAAKARADLEELARGAA